MNEGLKAEARRDYTCLKKILSVQKTWRAYGARRGEPTEEAVIKPRR